MSANDEIPELIREFLDWVSKKDYFSRGYWQWLTRVIPNIDDDIEEAERPYTLDDFTQDLFVAYAETAFIPLTGVFKIDRRERGLMRVLNRQRNKWRRTREKQITADIGAAPRSTGPIEEEVSPILKRQVMLNLSRLGSNCEYEDFKSICSRQSNPPIIQIAPNLHISIRRRNWWLAATRSNSETSDP